MPYIQGALTRTHPEEMTKRVALSVSSPKATTQCRARTKKVYARQVNTYEFAMEL